MLTQVELLKKYGLRVRGHLGQHLLLDPNIIRKIVDALALQPQDAVFEIGPGMGILTRQLLTANAQVIGVELDRELAALLRKELGHIGRFSLVEQDAR